MSDLINGSPAGAMPAGGYVLKAQTVRIACELVSKQTGDPAYPGLWAEVRRNLTIGEKRDLQDAARELDRRADEAHAAALAAAGEVDRKLAETLETDAETRRTLIAERTAILQAYARQSDQLLIDRFALIAPHVHGWNLYTVDEQGEFVPIPPPRTAGVAVINEIDSDLVIWLVQQTLTAYRLGFVPGSPTSGASQEPTPAPNGTESTAKTSRSRPSPKKSRSQNPSKPQA